MKLVYSSSPSHDVLKRHFFLGTLCDPWDLVELRFPVLGSGDFGSPDWNRVVLGRVAAMREFVTAHQGELVVFSDVDIQWFRPAQAAISQALETTDVVFQREHRNKQEANLGFLALRCNADTEAYLDVLVNAARDGNHDQTATNAMIAAGTMPCRHALLPSAFYNDLLGDRPPDMVMYHSIGTFPNASKSSLHRKLEMHVTMRARALESANILRPLPGVDQQWQDQRPHIHRIQTMTPAVPSC